MVGPNDAVMFDIDDTLIYSNNGKRIEEVYKIHKLAKHMGYKIVIVTARPFFDTNVIWTQEQLKNFNITYDELIFATSKNKGYYKRNSKYNHEVIIHVNEGIDGTLDFLKNNEYKFSYSKVNSGVCVAFNEAVKLSSKNILFLVMMICIFVLIGMLFLLKKLKKILLNFSFFQEQWFNSLIYI